MPHPTFPGETAHAELRSRAAAFMPEARAMARREFPHAPDHEALARGFAVAMAQSAMLGEGLERRREMAAVAGRRAA